MASAATVLAVLRAYLANQITPRKTLAHCRCHHDRASLWGLLCFMYVLSANQTFNG